MIDQLFLFVLEDDDADILVQLLHFYVQNINFNNKNTI
jgi:hypothetical protein